MSDSARKTAARTHPSYAKWLDQGKSDGFFGILADALQKDQRPVIPFNPALEHHSHLNLGHIKGIEAILALLLDPLDSRPTVAPIDLTPSYAPPVPPNK